MVISWVKTGNMRVMTGHLIMLRLVMPPTHCWQIWLSSVAVRFNKEQLLILRANCLLLPIFCQIFIILSALVENDHDIRSAEVKLKKSKCYSCERVFTSADCFSGKERSGWLVPGINNWKQHFLAEIEGVLRLAPLSPTSRTYICVIKTCKR
jgi:hypothetical protein